MNSQEQTQAASNNEAITSTAESTSSLSQSYKKAHIATIQKKQEKLVDMASVLLNSKSDDGPVFRYAVMRTGCRTTSNLPKN